MMVLSHQTGVTHRLTDAPGGCLGPDLSAGWWPSPNVLHQISGVLAAATDEVRAKYRGMSSESRTGAMAASRPSGDPADPVVVTLATLKQMGTRHRFLCEENIETDTELARIVSTHAPEIVEVNGVGVVVASQLLVTFGDNPERMGNEASFAALAGVAPPCPHPRAGPPVTGSPAAATGKQTTLFTALSSRACLGIQEPVNTSPSVPKKT